MRVSCLFQIVICDSLYLVINDFNGVCILFLLYYSMVIRETVVTILTWVTEKETFMDTNRLQRFATCLTIGMRHQPRIALWILIAIAEVLTALQYLRILLLALWVTEYHINLNNYWSISYLCKFTIDTHSLGRFTKFKKILLN